MRSRFHLAWHTAKFIIIHVNACESIYSASAQCLWHYAAAQCNAYKSLNFCWSHFFNFFSSEYEKACEIFYFTIDDFDLSQCNFYTFIDFGEIWLVLDSLLGYQFQISTTFWWALKESHKLHFCTVIFEIRFIFHSFDGIQNRLCSLKNLELKKTWRYSCEISAKNYLQKLVPWKCSIFQIFICNFEQGKRNKSV